MSRRSLSWFLVVGLLLAADAGAALAQGYSPSRYGAREIRCESDSRRHEYCRTYAYGRVRLERQLSKSACREYDTWGADRDGGGVWVRDGCRAVFIVLPFGPPHAHRPRPPHRGYRVTCKSDRFRPEYCPLQRWGRVELEKRLSDAPCRRYDTWGTDGGGIWVDRGCAAVFSVR